MTESVGMDTYVHPKVADEVSARAEANDESVSEWIAGAIEQRIDEDRLGDSADRYEIERRLERVVDRAADRAADRIVDQVTHDTESDGDGELADWGESD